MKKVLKVVKKIVSMALIVAMMLNVTISAYAGSPEGVTGQIVEQLQGFEYVIQTNELVVRTNSSQVNGKVSETKELSVGGIVQYLVDCLDGKWDGKLDTKAKIRFQIILKKS